MAAWRLRRDRNLPKPKKLGNGNVTLDVIQRGHSTPMGVLSRWFSLVIGGQISTLNNILGT